MHASMCVHVRMYVFTIACISYVYVYYYVGMHV